MCCLLELQEKVQRSRSDHLISRYRVWYWLEKELLPSQITSLQCIKDLAPAKHFITVFIFSSVGQVQSAVSIFGLRESMRGRERERERTPSRQQSELVASWASWPPASMVTSTGHHLPGGKVGGFCLNSPQNPRWIVFSFSNNSELFVIPRQSKGLILLLLLLLPPSPHSSLMAKSHFLSPAATFPARCSHKGADRCYPQTFARDSIQVIRNAAAVKPLQ